MTEEGRLQIAVADYLRLALPSNWLWWHTGGQANYDARRGGMLKRMGFKAGLPDLFILSPSGLLIGIELKAGKGRLSKAQKAVRDWFLEHGRPWHEARSIEDVQGILTRYGVPTRAKVSA